MGMRIYHIMSEEIIYHSFRGEEITYHSFDVAEDDTHNYYPYEF
jgi:hypothetical protein